MLTNEEQKRIECLTESNAEFKDILDSITAENRLILSKFTHELRNPLTLVKSTLQLIEQKHPETKEFKYWNSLGSDLDEMTDILNELSIYNHCNELHCAPCNLYELLTSTVERFQPLTLAKNLTLTFTCAETCKDYLTSYSCDCVKLKQAFTNLLKNAVEAADESTQITTTVSVTSDTEEQNGVTYIDIAVTNSGTPIPEEELSQIFEPFVTFKTGGTGLGLAIAKKAVSLHCGNLSVSQTDTTISFHIQLPIHSK